MLLFMGMLEVCGAIYRYDVKINLLGCMV